MDFCPASITAGAIFTALVIKDIYEKSYKDIIFHSVGGILSVIGLAAICKSVGDTAGWIILLIPFFVLIIGFYILWVEGTPDKKSVPMPTADNTCCPLCGQCPCHCNQNWPTDCDGVPLPAPCPTADSIKEVVKPSKPVEPPANTFGCPKKA